MLYIHMVYLKTSLILLIERDRVSLNVSLKEIQ